ncbi:carbonic anhydrase 2-like isoform X2 [Photinus pyralis]|uniref:carbonic anhydrase 2-like isoform X2 n=1 Tax=Photinus pyralis TaxID=7054 RepID=UPI0012671EF3|nr:carbonic anhydrase 2-like isoform X2 [Photinus pyralis]XP_031358451.1 carbonic anhydrase 2-like isoform X2 [Photinus pyralis]
MFNTLRTGLLFSLLIIITTASSDNCVPHNGRRQSPIKIWTKAATSVFAPPLNWSYGYALKPQKMFLNNTGLSLTLTVNHKEPLQISSGMLNVPYKFEQLHFHWGEHDGVGSEHIIDGFTYPMEMHIVHSQNLREDIDKFVVIAYFFMITPTANPSLQGLLDAAIALKHEQQHKVTPFALAQILPDRCSYFTYNGSLTTPPYTESVTWILATSEVPISRTQLGVLREVAKKHKGLRNNYRCIQNTNERSVYFLSGKPAYSHNSLFP